jgi:hypothetical protein
VDVITHLPTWVVALLAVLVAGILLAQNLGWLLAARAMLETQRRKRVAQDEQHLGRTSDGDKRPPAR